ncbi:MAG: hypothetical protein AVDCRST_MAG78-830, partial [uncultured Rubrobacteraceae bacterium]
GKQRHRHRPRPYRKVPARRCPTVRYRGGAPDDRRLGGETVVPGQPRACGRSRELGHFENPSVGRRLRPGRRGAAPDNPGQAGAGGSQRPRGNAGRYGEALAAEYLTRPPGRVFLEPV